MLINDPKGKFQFRIDKTRRIVYQKNVGMWESEDWYRYDLAFREKVIPYLGTSPWTTFSDLREYSPSTKVTPEMIKENIENLVKNGFQGGAVLVDSATLKMQLNRSTKGGLGVEPTYFNDEKEADAWLKSQGF